MISRAIRLNRFSQRLLSTFKPDDVLIMNGAVFHGFHGVFAEEQELGQKFIIDLELRTETSRAALTDSLEDTIDMTKVYRDIHKIVATSTSAKSEALLENLGERIAVKMLTKYQDKVRSVKVTVKKPQVALAGILDYSAIEVERDQMNYTKEI